ncbi:MAG: hypothetical protein U0163_09890 [Gemmatimonadaceae bacterium]
MQLFPGINEQRSLVTKYFMRKPRADKYVRRPFASGSRRSGEHRDWNDHGDLLLGDAMMQDWRERTRDRATAMAPITTSSPVATAKSRSTRREERVRRPATGTALG